MKKWEHVIIEKGSVEDLAEKLNMFGRQGWEPYGVTKEYVYLKREIQEVADEPDVNYTGTGGFEEDPFEYLRNLLRTGIRDVKVNLGLS